MVKEFLTRALGGEISLALALAKPGQLITNFGLRLGLR